MSRAHQDLPRDEEGDQRVCNLTKIPASVEQVVFVATVGISLRIDVVAEQVDPLPFRSHGRGARCAGVHAFVGAIGESDEHGVSRAILGEKIVEAVAFSGRVFGVGADVQVEASSVAEEEIGGATTGGNRFEKEARRGIDIEGRHASRRGCDRHTVFGLDSDDTTPHVTGRPSGRIPGRRPLR